MVAVIIPVAGDDHSPEFTDDSITVSSIVDDEPGFKLEPPLTLTITDQDKLIQNNCSFELKSISDDISDIFKLNSAPGDSVDVVLADSFSLDNLLEDHHFGDLPI